jgi:hypothetical protein
MLEKGTYAIVGGPAAGDFGHPVVRDQNLQFHVQNGSQPTPVSCALSSIEKLEKLPPGPYNLKIKGTISNHPFTAEYNPCERSGELTIT